MCVSVRGGVFPENGLVGGCRCAKIGVKRKWKQNIPLFPFLGGFPHSYSHFGIYAENLKKIEETMMWEGGSGRSGNRFELCPIINFLRLARSSSKGELEGNLLLAFEALFYRFVLFWMDFFLEHCLGRGGILFIKIHKFIRNLNIEFYWLNLITKQNITVPSR